MAGIATRTPPGYTLVKQGVSLEEYARLPDDGRRLELVDGDLVIAPSHSSGHSFSGLRIANHLMNWVQAKGLGEVHVEVDVRVAPETVLRPDFLFISANHPQAGRSVPRFTHPPELVIEVISPDSRVRDWHFKYGRYEAFGIANYWIADPYARAISAFTLVNGAYEEVRQSDELTFEAPPFPGLRMNLDDVFGPRR